MYHPLPLAKAILMQKNGVGRDFGVILSIVLIKVEATNCQLLDCKIMILIITVLNGINILT
jgi:hypothetical protein